MISRGDIITEGLSKAGRPDLVSDARLWLNLFLEEQYNNQDWSWLVKTQPSLAVVQGGTLPSDYRSAKVARIDTDQNATPLIVTEDADEWDWIQNNAGGANGTPTHMYIERSTGLFYFSPAPSSRLTFSLSYYFVPDLPDHTDPTTDSEIPVWGLPFRILTDHIKAEAMEYNDDTRQDKAAMGVTKKIADAKMNNHDMRAGRHKLRMGKSFKKRF